MRLAGKNAIVTGAASGMGAAIAELFGAEGAGVALLDLEVETARSIAARLERALALRVDVGDSTQVDAAFSEAVAALGGIDVVVHAAGLDDRKVKADVAAGQDTANIIIEMTDAQWDEQIRVNLSGTFFVVRASLREMVPRGRGSIVTIASVGAINGCYQVAYCTAKGGVLTLTRSVAQEVWSSGVRVNAIAPGLIDTPMLRRNPLAVTPPPNIGRFGRPDEVASTALFLATDESSFITGETIVVSGPSLTI